MILPLPRTGPSRRCRLQLTTKIRLSRRSREASVIEPSDSGSSISIAHEGPDFAARRRFQSAIFQILDEAGVIDRLNRAESHRHGWKFPKVGHEPGMRIGREAAAGFQLPPEIF